MNSDPASIIKNRIINLLGCHEGDRGVLRNIALNYLSRRRSSSPELPALVYKAIARRYPEINSWSWLDGKSGFEPEHRDQKHLMAYSKSNSASFRATVAFDDKCPTAILEILSKDDSEYVRINVARNRNTSVEALEELSIDNSQKVRIAVAENPNTSLSILSRLATDKDIMVRHAIAENNNTPYDVVISLVKDKSSEVRSKLIFKLHKDALTLLALDKSDEIRSTIARIEAIPFTTQDILSRDNNENIRFLLADNKSCNPAVLEYLSNDASDSVRLAISNNSNTTEDIRNKLIYDFSKHEDWRYRLAIAKNTKTPHDILEQLSEDDVINVRKGLATNPAINEALAKKLTAELCITEPENNDKLFNTFDSEVVVALIAGSIERITTSSKAPIFDTFLHKLGDFSIQEQNTLLKDLKKLEEVYSLEFMNSSLLPREMIFALLSEICDSALEREDAGLLIDLADQPDMPPELLRRIACSDPVYSVLCALAGNESTPSDILLKLAKYDYSEGGAAYISNKSITDDLLNKIVASGGPLKARLFVASHPATSCETLLLLADDQSEDVRIALARNESAPDELLSHLAKDCSSLVRMCVAKNKNTNVHCASEILAGLAESKDEEVLLAVSAHPHTTQKDRLKLLTRAAGSRRREIRNKAFLQMRKEFFFDKPSLVTHNYNSELESFLNNFLQKESDYYGTNSRSELERLVAAVSIHSSNGLLDKLAIASEAEIRLAVAINPSTSRKTLLRLTQDTDQTVRFAAAQMSSQE